MSVDGRTHGDAPAAAPPPGDEVAYAGTELDAMARAENYYSWIASVYEPWLRGRVVEVGAGIGTFAARIARQSAVRELILLEPAANLSTALRRRFAGDDRVRVRERFLRDVDLGGPVDAIVLVNVLEHVESDAGLLRDARSRLAADGALLLFVPALPFLYGTLDEAFEHHRRYTRPGLRRRLEEAGYRVRILRYANLPGVLPWWVAGRLLRKRTIGAREMRLYDRLVLSWVLWLEDRVHPPIGQSLLAVATNGGGE